MKTCYREHGRNLSLETSIENETTLLIVKCDDCLPLYKSKVHVVCVLYTQSVYSLNPVSERVCFMHSGKWLKNRPDFACRG